MVLLAQTLRLVPLCMQTVVALIIKHIHVVVVLSASLARAVAEWEVLALLLMYRRRGPQQGTVETGPYATSLA